MFSIIATFAISPSPLTVAVEQETAVFYCQHLTSDGINWRVNGQSLNILNSPNIISSSDNPQSNGIKVYSLSIRILSEFNQSTVVCVATFFDGSPSQFTSPVTLLIQGLSTMAIVTNYLVNCAGYSHKHALYYTIYCYLQVKPLIMAPCAQ